MQKGRTRSLAVFMAAVLLMVTLVAPVQANIAAIGGRDGGGTTARLRLAVYFMGLGKTVVQGNSESEVEAAKVAYVTRQMHALTIAAHASVFLTIMLNQMTGKLAWSDTAYMAVYGAFYRQFMYQLYSPFRNALFVIWCMLLYRLALSAKTGSGN